MKMQSVEWKTKKLFNMEVQIQLIKQNPNWGKTGEEKFRNSAKNFIGKPHQLNTGEGKDIFRHWWQYKRNDYLSKREC